MYMYATSCKIKEFHRVYTYLYGIRTDGERVEDLPNRLLVMQRKGGKGKSCYIIITIFVSGP